MINKLPSEIQKEILSYLKITIEDDEYSCIRKFYKWHNYKPKITPVSLYHRTYMHTRKPSIKNIQTMIRYVVEVLSWNLKVSKYHDYCYCNIDQIWYIETEGTSKVESCNCFLSNFTSFQLFDHDVEIEDNLMMRPSSSMTRRMTIHIIPTAIRP